MELILTSRSFRRFVNPTSHAKSSAWWTRPPDNEVNPGLFEQPPQPRAVSCAPDPQIVRIRRVVPVRNAALEQGVHMTPAEHSRNSCSLTHTDHSLASIGDAISRRIHSDCASIYERKIALIRVW